MQLKQDVIWLVFGLGIEILSLNKKYGGDPNAIKS